MCHSIVLRCKKCGQTGHIAKTCGATAHESRNIADQAAP